MVQSYNSYGRQLTPEEILSGKHRSWVGGMWGEMGKLQIDFMKNMGLLPSHCLLDVGCGALRGGVNFIEYLQAGHYYGIDINESLIKAGLQEIEHARLAEKNAILLVDGDFEFQRFGKQFDFAFAQSVFTHLPMNHIIKCLANVATVLKPEGEFFATFFESPSSVFTKPLLHEPGGITTHFDKDPFHYSLEEFAWMARNAGMTMRSIGDWAHPRDQKMLGFKVESICVA